MNEYTMLLFGVDSLWVNVLYGDREVSKDEECFEVQPAPRPLDTVVFEELAAWQEQARKEEKPIPTRYSFDDMPLLMYPNGGGLTSSFRFILRNHALEVKIGMGKRNGIIGKVRFSAEYLWKMRDIRECLLFLQVFLIAEVFDAPVYLQVSEVHICADVTGYDFSKANYDPGFIRRSAFQRHLLDENYTFVEEEEQGEEEDDDYIPGPDKLHMRYRPITGYTFGSHKSAVGAVIYNKTNYIKYKAKTTTWFHPLWQERGWNGKDEVWRVELRLKRQALGEAKIDSAYDLIKQLHAIWQYGTGQWLRYVVPGEDSNRARWQAQDVWIVVQSASQQDVTSDLDLGPIQREHKRTENMEKMTAQIVGCLITLHAWHKKQEPCGEEEDISEVLHHFYPNALDYLDKKQKREERKGKKWDFTQGVRYKQVFYSQANTQAVA
jgi:hypothetical protein